MSNSNHFGECKLCFKHSELQESHIIPKFVGKWLKKTSSSGRIRNAVNPNVRIQDLSKEHLLCKECEQRFAIFEKRFAEQIFHPFHSENKKLFHYDKWLQKFIISLNWRVAISGINNMIPEGHDSFKELENTLETWRLFLLDQIDSPGSNKNHLIFVGITDLTDFNKIQPAPYNHFTNMRFLRSVFFGTVNDEHNRTFIYSSLGGIVFVSHIHPKSFIGWTNQTKVTKRGTLKTLQNNSDLLFGTFLGSLMARIDSHISNNISEKQNEIINRGILDDINKSLKSKSLGLIGQLSKQDQFSK
ncbi:hypothetical protein GLW07_21875 [Bacillus hwajinpoensis]|uniref:HNH endonuclease n=1 Tax=Guptibacillus hwajinpoensis TaxID=208199 RepID=A0A845F5F0_9BACL|nr:hypothetical protein [Pseudalkalibacillus hwajinpoensis]MYL65991.1 hypothetical protein [Pseudalkalibacillus hwajinpoensis]